jgi:universal stress protein E
MARRQFKTILVGIDAPDERKHLALKRAAQLAQRTGARLVLFHSAFSPYVAGPSYYRSTLEDAGVRKMLAGQREALEKLAAPLRQQGLKIALQAVWDYPPYEGIVREALRSRPDLVVVESRRRALGARLFLTNNDWQLIRLCPAPLLLVKQPKAYGKTRVLAAVDPLHVAAKPAQLDQRILEIAQALATAHAGRLDVVHAYLPLHSYTPSVYGKSFAAAVDPRLEQQHRHKVQRELERSVADFDLPKKQLHLETGAPSTVLPALARKLSADVVVMGAVSRHGLERLFIGSTAERTLDRLPCDVLVVKPRGYKTTVALRPTPGG